MDEAGIAKAVIMTYTDLPGAKPDALEYIADAVTRYPDRFVGYARLHPGHGKVALQLLEGDGQLSHALLSPLVDGLMLPLFLPLAVTHRPYRPNEKPLTGLTHTCTVRCRR
jgi:hypothetical protein